VVTDLQAQPEFFKICNKSSYWLICWDEKRSKETWRAYNVRDSLVLPTFSLSSCHEMIIVCRDRQNIVLYTIWRHIGNFIADILGGHRAIFLGQILCGNQNFVITLRNERKEGELALGNRQSKSFKCIMEAPSPLH
jgi:hypothetical protein